MRAHLMLLQRYHGFELPTILYRSRCIQTLLQHRSGWTHRPECPPCRLMHLMCGATRAKVERPKQQLAHFCSACGGRIELAIPPDEAEWRHVCIDCKRVTYHNPKMVVGVICEHDGKILMCKRAIEPCKGMWTVPAGYMEMAESSAEGAVRETWEEAGAAVKVVAPYVHFDIPRIGQAYVLFRAELQPPFTFNAGAESMETVLMQPDDIPFDQVAFSSISLALRFYIEDMKAGQQRVHHGVIEKAEGALPNDPASYRLRDHMVIDINRPAAP